jgi:Tol biopolymer transport system component
VDGASERKLVNMAGNHLFPLWMPDGKRIVYASDRSGPMDAWQLEIENGEARGEPVLLRRNLGRFLPMSITSTGDLYYGLRTGSTDVFVTTLADPTRNAKRATLLFPGRNTAPAWSPDGKVLAYLSRRGSENFGQESRSIVIRHLDSEEERELLPKLAHLEKVRWSPDGKALLVSGSDNKGRGGLYLVDPETAAVRPLITEPGSSFRGFHAVWSKDGKSVFYIHPSGEVRQKDIATGRESLLYREKQLHHIAASPNGEILAMGAGNKSIILISTTGSDARAIPFEGLTELEWGRELLAARGVELWRIPLEGGSAVKLDSPGNRDPGFSLHPDGERLALTAGNAKSEIWMLPLR